MNVISIGFVHHGIIKTDAKLCNIHFSTKCLRNSYEESNCVYIRLNYLH